MLHIGGGGGCDGCLNLELEKAFLGHNGLQHTVAILVGNALIKIYIVSILCKSSNGITLLGKNVP